MAGINPGGAPGRGDGGGTRQGFFSRLGGNRSGANLAGDGGGGVPPAQPVPPPSAPIPQPRRGGVPPAQPARPVRGGIGIHPWDGTPMDLSGVGLGPRDPQDFKRPFALGTLLDYRRLQLYG